MPQVDKALFVVDRKNLDYQTVKVHDKFEKGRRQRHKDVNPARRATPFLRREVICLDAAFVAVAVVNSFTCLLLAATAFSVALGLRNNEKDR